MRAGAVVLAVVALAGCGYGFAGRGPTIPVAAKSVYVGMFSNKTRQYGLEVRLRRAIQDEFRRRGTFEVSNARADADLILTGAIRSVHTIPVASGPTDEPIAYRSVMSIGFRLVEAGSGQVIHETPLLVEEQDFAAVSSVVVPASPHFQQSTIDLEDLATITNVQVGESRRNHALADLLDQVARDVYVRSVEGF